MTEMLLFVFGLFLGSFGNVVSLRLHSHEAGILTGRSHCPQCKYRLGFFDNIPLLSWLLLKGRCRKCRTPISWQYPAAELFFGLLFLLVALATPNDDLPLLFWRLALVFSIGILVLSDLRFMDIPDAVSIPTIGFLLVTAGVNSVLPISGLVPSLPAALLGAAVIYAFFTLQILIPAASASVLHGTFRAIREALVSVLVFPVWILFSLVGLGKWFEDRFEEDDDEEEVESWIGGGDMRIALIIGLALGWKIGLVAVFLSYFIGTLIAIPLLLFGKKRVHQMVAFGPMLALGLIMAMLWGERILALYLGFLGGW